VVKSGRFISRHEASTPISPRYVPQSQGASATSLLIDELTRRIGNFLVSTCYVRHTNLVPISFEQGFANTYCRWHDHQRHFHTCTQAQFERPIAVKLARFNLFKRDCFCWEASDSDAILIMSDEWHEAAQEAEIGDRAGVKLSQRKYNTICFDPDRLWSYFQNANRQNESYHAGRAERGFMLLRSAGCPCRYEFLLAHVGWKSVLSLFDLKYCYRVPFPHLFSDRSICQDREGFLSEHWF
jgi:hypothetical protein